MPRKQVEFTTRSKQRNAEAWVGAGEQVKRLTIDVPESLHRRIKATCAVNGTKMADAIRLLLEREYPSEE